MADTVWIDTQDDRKPGSAADRPFRRFRLIDMTHAHRPRGGAPVVGLGRRRFCGSNASRRCRKPTASLADAPWAISRICIATRARSGWTSSRRKGPEISYRIAADVEVVVENMRPDVKHRLNTDHEMPKANNPGIIDVSISGHDPTDPYAIRGGVDQIAQGIGGIMSVTGERDGEPLRMGVPVADRSAHADDSRRIVSERLLPKTTKAWDKLPTRAGRPSGAVLNIRRDFEVMQARHLGVARPIRHRNFGEIDLLANPVNIEGGRKDFMRRTPQIDGHSRQILSTLGYDEAQIADLKAHKVV